MIGPIGYNYDPNKYYFPITYPMSAPPRPDNDTYGDIKPGASEVVSKTQNARLKEILIEGAEITKNAYGSLLAANVQRVARKQTKGAPLNRSLVYSNTPGTANDILTQLTSDRQTVIIIGAIIVFLVVMFMSRGK